MVKIIFKSTYFIGGLGEFVKVIDEFENLILVDLTDGGRVIEEVDLHLGKHLLFQIALGCH